MSTWQHGEVRVRWLGGGLLVQAHGAGLLLDAPPAVVEALGADLPSVQSVLLTSGRLSSVGGLVALLVALERHRVTEVPLSLRFPLGEERGASLAETWVRGWPDRYPLTLDAQMPGGHFDAGPFMVSTASLPAGEPVWRTGEVEGRIAVAARVSVADTTVVWVPGAAPGGAVRRVCRGADLAVVEVGVLPWPRTERAWRLSQGDVLEASEDVGELWMVGDDGRLVGELE